MPAASSIALLLNTGDQVRTDKLLKEAEGAATRMQLELHVRRARPDVGVKFWRRYLLKATVTTKPGHRGEHEGNR